MVKILRQMQVWRERQLCHKRVKDAWTILWRDQIYYCVWSWVKIRIWRYNFKKISDGTDTAFKIQSCNPDSLRASRQEANWEAGDWGFYIQGRVVFDKDSSLLEMSQAERRKPRRKKTKKLLGIFLGFQFLYAVQQFDGRSKLESHVRHDHLSG